MVFFSLLNATCSCLCLFVLYEQCTCTSRFTICFHKFNCIYYYLETGLNINKSMLSLSDLDIFHLRQLDALRNRTDRVNTRFSITSSASKEITNIQVFTEYIHDILLIIPFTLYRMTRTVFRPECSIKNVTTDKYQYDCNRNCLT